MKKILIAIASVLFFSNVIAQNSSWKYLNNGTNKGTAWRNSSFKAACVSEHAEFHKAIIVSDVRNSSNEYVTTSFRKSLSVTSSFVFTPPPTLCYSQAT